MILDRLLFTSFDLAASVWRHQPGRRRRRSRDGGRSLPDGFRPVVGAVDKPTGRSISVDRRHGSKVHQHRQAAWHLRRFHRRIGGDLELAGLKDMVKAMRRELGVPPKKERYGTRTQDLAY